MQCNGMRCDAVWWPNEITVVLFLVVVVVVIVIIIIIIVAVVELANEQLTECTKSTSCHRIAFTHYAHTFASKFKNIEFVPLILRNYLIAIANRRLKIIKTYDQTMDEWPTTAKQMIGSSPSTSIPLERSGNEQFWEFRKIEMYIRFRKAREMWERCFERRNAHCCCTQQAHTIA